MGHSWELHAEPDLGVTIPMVDPSEMQGLPPTERPPLHPVDEEITSEAYARQSSGRLVGEAAQPQVDWIISSNLFHGNVEAGAPSSTGRGSRVEPRLQEITSRLTRGRSKRQRVEDSFAAVQPSRLRHPDPKKRAVRPKRSWSVLPDTQAFADKFVHLYVSDSGLVHDAPDPAAKRRRLSRGLVRTRDPSHTHPPQPNGAGRLSWLWVPTNAEQAKELEREREFELVLRRPGGSDEILALHWDETRDEIYFTPVAARGDLLKVATSAQNAQDEAMATSTARMAVLRRSWSSHESVVREGERADVVSDNPTDVMERLHAASEAQQAMQPPVPPSEREAGTDIALSQERFEEYNGNEAGQLRGAGERDVAQRSSAGERSRPATSEPPATNRGDLDVDNLFDEEEDEDAD